MEPIRVIARVVARDGKADELKALLRKMVMPSRAENGCRYYELFESNIPGLFYFHELWNSREQLAAHAASSHFADVSSKAKALIKEPFEVNLLQEVQ